MQSTPASRKRQHDCELRSETPPIMSDDRLTEHETENDRELITTANICYQCEFCDSKLSTLSALNQHEQKFHVQSHQPVKKLRRCHTRYRSNEFTSSTCDYCGQVFASVATVKRHYLRVHASGISPCNLCAKICPNELALEDHMRKIHSNTRLLDESTNCCNPNRDTFHIATSWKAPFKCAICNKGFWVQNALDYHEYSVHIEPKTKNHGEFVGQRILIAHYEEQERRISGIRKLVDDNESTESAEFLPLKKETTNELFNRLVLLTNRYTHFVKRMNAEEAATIRNIIDQLKSLCENRSISE